MQGALVGIIMGSTSDWDTMRHAAEALDRLRVPYEKKVISAHRTPDRLYDYARTARDRISEFPGRHIRQDNPPRL